MKEIKVKKDWPRVSELKIVDLQKDLNGTLPKGYSEHLLKYNGGRSKQNMYTMINDQFAECGVLNWFFSISDDNNYSLKNNKIVFLDRVPKELLPIGDDPYGNLICLSISGDSYNKVYFWDHENESTIYNKAPWYDNIYLIANSFEEFVNKLYFYELDEDIRGNEIERSVHDRYSLPTAHYIKHYKPGVILDFFAKAPADTEDFVIEEHTANKDLVLYYDDKIKGIRFKRMIKPDGSFEDSEETLSK